MDVLISTTQCATLKRALRMARVQALNSFNARSNEGKQAIAQYDEALQALADAEIASQPVAPKMRKPQLPHLSFIAEMSA